MSNERVPVAIPPNCPKCGEVLDTVIGYPYPFGTWMILTVSCSHCHVLLHTQIFAMASQEQPVGEPEPPSNPKLWKPS